MGKRKLGRNQELEREKGRDTRRKNLEKKQKLERNVSVVRGGRRHYRSSR